MKKSWIFTAALAVFTLLLAGYILWPQETDGISTDYASAQGRGDFFEVFRQERESLREEESRYLGDIIDSETASAQAKRDAEAAKLTLVKRMEDEFVIESMLLAKDYKDVAVTVGDGGVSVVLESDVITDEDMAKVLDIVCRQTGYSAHQVYIISSR